MEDGWFKWERSDGRWVVQMKGEFFKWKSLNLVAISNSIDILWLENLLTNNFSLEISVETRPVSHMACPSNLIHQ